MLLAIDTATTTASIALYDLEAQQLLAEFTWQAERRQTQQLVAHVHHLLAQLQREPKELTALSATTGPGSFSGVRIGISVVKGIGLGLPSLPQVVGVPTLCVTAAPWVEVAAACCGDVLVCACIQAGRGRFNWALFEPHRPWRRPAPEEHGSGVAAQLAQELARLPAFIWLVGEISAQLLEALQGVPTVTCVDNVTGMRRAGQLARLAGFFLSRGEADDLTSLQPIYLRDL